ncbi:purple acid phosphatase 2-like isoform X1 [Tripterygium wilfordii]|uniref:Purple acid phosphatase 2-like isoform X1 n=1 Tax=Tripterygium wilfordii TaxID=458696 RepID=A0A7J7D396_TRIWF|nr:purple acid phosphatase 2-like isoform X1 [Tripterygium wilfordii]
MQGLFHTPAKGQTVLFVGDLSYADDYPFHGNNRWDKGEDSQREMLLINIGFGVQEIMKLILLHRLMTLPQSSYSAYHEASFDQSILDIKNRIHAYFCWHRSQNGYAVEADSIFLCGWLLNRYFNPLENTSIAAV